MTDSDADVRGGQNDGTPFSGVSSVHDANAATKAVSSEILELIDIKGKASEPGPGVVECPGKNRDTYFRMNHPWNFVPESSGQLRAVMERLRDELPRQGWEIKEYGQDGSRNKNLSLTADNDKKKFSVNVTHMGKSKPHMLLIHVISGCYRVPEGETVRHF